MDPRLPPIPVALTGAPRTGIAALPAPRPPYRLTLHRDGPTRTIHAQRADGTGPVTHAPLLHVPASPDGEAFLHSTLALYHYEWSIRITWSGDGVMAALLDDLVPRVPITPEQIAAFEATWQQRLAALP